MVDGAMRLSRPHKTFSHDSYGTVSLAILEQPRVLEFEPNDYTLTIILI